MPTLRLIRYKYEHINRFPLPIVEMVIKSEKHNFVIDTGACETVLCHSLMRLLTNNQIASRIRRSIGGVGGDGSAESSFAVNVQFNFVGVVLPYVTFIPSLTTVSNRFAVAISGLIGQDVLRQFSSVEFDWKNEVVRFKP